MINVVSVKFRNGNKIYDFDAKTAVLKRGDSVIVEVEKGIGMAKVVANSKEVDASTIKRALKKIVRKVDDVDQERVEKNTSKEEEAFKVCKELYEKHKLEMKLISVEYLFDASKAIFYFTADGRVDFRELVKDLAKRLYIRIEMKQVGVRDETKILGGIGPCGRELCCKGFLTNFSPITIKMAKEQNIVINPQKVSGVCGRLMCCLSYEMDLDGNKKKGSKGDKKDCGGCCSSGGKESCGPQNTATNSNVSTENKDSQKTNDNQDKKSFDNQNKEQNKDTNKVFSKDNNRNDNRNNSNKDNGQNNNYKEKKKYTKDDFKKRDDSKKGEEKPQN